MNQTHAGDGEDPLATALEKYALASEQVGEARLAQDKQIQTRFLAGWSTTLNTNLMFAQRARKSVENSRLSLDATKAKGKTGVGRGMNPDDEMASMTEEARQEVEQKEDEFVNQTEEAVGVMKNVCVDQENWVPNLKFGRSGAYAVIDRSLIPLSLCAI